MELIIDMNSKTKKLRKIALEMIKNGVKSADPENLIESNIEVKDNIIRIVDEEFDREDYEKIVVFGVGKASVSMASGLKKINPDDGLIITKIGNVYENHKSPVDIREAYHPYPKQENLEAAEEILYKLENINDALIIFLVSGGGSALFLSPVEGISVSEMNRLNKLLVKSGANISQINSVRKHVSRVKGGRFAELCSGKGDLVSLIISDVVGDDLSVIASGPTYPDHKTFQDAVEVLNEYDLWNKIPERVKNHLEKGIERLIEETPKELDVDNFLIGNNMSALKGAAKVAKNDNFKTLILTSQNQGEAKEVAKPYMGIAKEIQDTGNPVEPPSALIIGGEMTVTFENIDLENVKGGPNREFVLASALELQDRENIVVASVDSDGIDGIDKAGAIADCDTIQRSKLDAKKYLREHNTQEFFEELDDSIEFDSRTNVNDITVILIEEKTD